MSLKTLIDRGFSSTIRERFWAKVEITERCWLWTGSIGEDGYGRIGRGDRNSGVERAHRVSWMLHFGPISVGLNVLHKCDNRRCVRPDHLFEGTKPKNSRDMVEKGRSLVGEKQPNHVLTSRQVLEIRSRYASGSISQRDLGAEYSVSHGTIGRITRREHWKHL